MNVPILIIFDPSRQKAKEAFLLINIVWMLIKLFARIFTKFFSTLYCQNFRA